MRQQKPGCAGLREAAAAPVSYVKVGPKNPPSRLGLPPRGLAEISR